MGFFDWLSGKSRQIATESSDELIRNLEALAELFPSDPKASQELLFVLVSLEEAEPQATWPAPLREVIARGEDVIDTLVGGLEEGDPNQITGRRLYFAVALCYIQSPRVVEPLCRFLEQDRETSKWPSPPEERVILFDAIEMIYIATARMFYWTQARDILSRLRAILEKGQQKTMLNALPYALRAVGFIGEDTDVELVQQFVFFDCPAFDLSEVRVRFEAKHAIHALRHPKERDLRANTRSSTWACD